MAVKILWGRRIVVVSSDKRKYGSSFGDWESGASVKTTFRSPWKVIYALRVNFKAHKLIVGNVRRDRCWEDGWWGGDPFSNCFPSLYRSSSLHNAVISSSFIPDPVDNHSWNFHFRREPSERGSSELAEILSCLDGVRLSEFRADSW